MKNLFKFLGSFLTAMLLMGGWSLQAQTLTVGTGTASNQGAPVNAYYGYTYSQMIYPAADIVSAGGVPAVITKIRFMRNAGNAGANDAGWTVYMANSARTAFSSTTDWEPIANFSQVFSGNITFAATGAWTEITLSNPFIWDGTSNLIIAVDENNSSYNGGSTSTWRYTSSVANSTITYYSDSNNPNPATPPTASTRYGAYPNLQLDITPLVACAGTPAPGNTTSSLPAVCSGSSAQVTLSTQTNYLGVTGVTFQWESYNGTSWGAISGATSRNYTFSGLTSTTDFRLKVVCNGTDSAYSTPVTVVVNPLPTVSVSPAQSIACASGEVVALTASGADTYAWSPATGLSATTGSSVNATVTANRTYTVTGTTTATGCTNTATANVTTITAHGVSVSKSPSLSCSTGSPVTLNVTNNPGIPMEYEWYDSLGTVVQAWAPGTSYSFTPSTAGSYKFSVKARVASCPANESFPQYITFNVGFSGTVVVNDVYCGQTTGSIVVNNGAGPGINEIWYSNDFNTTALYGGELFGPNASITGNKLQLTPNTGSASGGFMVYNPNAINARTMSVDFDLTVGGSASSTNGADGLSWSFGPDVIGLPSTNPTNAEQGSGTGLKIGFDAYGTTSPNLAGIYLMYNCTEVNLTSTTPGVIQYLNNLTWKGGTKHIKISINELGQLTMTFNTTTIFNNIQLPAAYVNADKSTWKHGFAARTGGVSEVHEIDNLLIKYSNVDYGINTVGAGVPSSWQAGNTFNNLAIGSYDVYIANSNDHNCNQLLGTFALVDSMTPAPGNTFSTAANICANNASPVTLSLQNNYSSYTGITWQWQSFDGTNWANIPGANSSTYSFTALAQTTDFRAVVACDTNMTGNSNLVTVIAVQPPTINVTPAAVTLCSGELPTLTASGADTYTWSPSTGLSGTTGASVQASPTAYQQYTITGTETATGCSNTTTAYVTPIEFLPVEAGPTATICSAGNPVTLDVTSIPDYVAGFGSLEFQWLDSANNIVQDWSAASTYTFTPTTEGYYFYYVNIRSTACAAVPPTEMVEFYVGFGGDVSTIDINCYVPAGTISVANAFGQGNGGTWYSNNFATVTLNSAEATLHQNASITGGRAVLTPSATGNRGGLTILNPTNIPGIEVQYDISFKMTADQPYDQYGTGGADGIAYSFGPDANYSNTLGNPCSGFGSKLRVVFDAAGNSNQNGNSTGIYLSYGYGGTDQVGPGLPTTLAYSPNLSLWKLLTDVPVAIKITASGKFTLTVNDTVVFNQVQLPAEFQTTNKSTWKHVFSSQTGGDALRQAIDDLNIKYTSLNFGLAAGNSNVLPSTWQNSSIFTGLTAGDYDVYVSDANDTLCNKFLGTYSIIDRNPQVNWPLDTVLCAGQTLVLDAGNAGSYYEWNTGPIGTDEQFYTVTGPGTYIVDVEDTIGCTTVGYISVLPGTLPVVSLGNDTALCSGSSLTLDAGTDGDSYLWSDNSTNQTLDVTAGGNYSVTVTNSVGCSTSDAISVTLQNTPTVSGIGTTVNGQSVAFTAQTPQYVNTYTWAFGDGNTITTLSPNITYNYANCGTYNVTLTVENNGNCGQASETTSVTFGCTGIEEMDANAGLNIYPNPARDFIAIANPNGLSIERLTVYDAAGKQMFISTNASNLVPDITSWAPGMYLVKIDAEGKTFVQRVIIGK